VLRLFILPDSGSQFRHVPGKTHILTQTLPESRAAKLKWYAGPLFETLASPTEKTNNRAEIACMFSGSPFTLTNKTMNDYTHFVGIDVSKHTLDVVLRHPPQDHPREVACQLPNSASGHVQLSQWLSRQGAPIETTVICLECTGRYDDGVLEQLTLRGWVCALEKTTVLQKVKPEHHRKDDAFDAGLLAEYAYRYRDKLIPYTASHPVIEQLRLLYRERRRLVSRRGAVKQLQSEHRYNQVGAPSPADVLAQELWQEQRTFYDGQIKILEEQMQALVASDEGLKHRYDQVEGVKGIGSITTLKWLCLFYEKEHLSARHIASRFGLAPHGETSGTSRHRAAHSTGHGEREMRKLLTMCARSAGAHYTNYHRYKMRKLAEGKASHLVTNNIINKLIRVVCAIWNENTAFDPNHISRFAQIEMAAP